MLQRELSGLYAEQWLAAPPARRGPGRHPGPLSRPPPGGGGGGCRGYRAALAEGGLRVLPEGGSAPPRGDGAPAAIDRMLASGAPPDAIVAAHDDYAVAVLSTLAAAGLRTPDDVAVV